MIAGAIHAATHWASRLMNVSDQVDTLTEGKYADIIACALTCSATIDLPQNVDIVIKHGNRYK